MAALCTLRLLRKHPTTAPDEVWTPPHHPCSCVSANKLHALTAERPQVKCITFGSPAAGNEALVDHVRSFKWESHFHHIALAGAPGTTAPAAARLPT